MFFFSFSDQPHLQVSGQNFPNHTSVTPRLVTYGKTQPQVPSVHLGQEFLRQRPSREEAAESDDLFRQSCHANKCWWIG